MHTLLTADIDTSAMAGVVLIGIALIIYLLPTVIVICNGHPHGVGIFLLNAFLGWTLIGWLCALIWSVCKPVTHTVIVNNSSTSPVLPKPKSTFWTAKW
jgi:hypothetical protein